MDKASVYRPALNAAVIFALIAVAVGAMGAHALRPYLTDELQVSFETAVRYQFYHALALGFAGLIHHFKSNVWIRSATWFLIAGIILFSGSIYLLVYLKSTNSIGLGGLGIITPIGGLCFITGWLLLLVGINKR